MIVREENVLRLHIAMHETVAMRVVERGTHFLGDAQRVIDGQFFLAIQPVTQRSAGDERRDVIERAGGFTGVDEGNDVWMRELRGDANLAQEPFRPDRSAELLPQYLDRNLPLVLALLGEMYGGHAAVPKQPLYGVAIVERTFWG